MEEKKLNLDAPFISVRRIPTNSENTKKTRTKKVKGLSQETLIRLLKDDQSFDHVVEITASVPFLWEQTPGKPKIHMATTLIKESSLNKAIDIISSTNVIRDDVILEHRDLILPATREFSMKQKKESSLDQEEKMKKNMTLQKVHLNDSKKALIGFLPRICSKDSLSVDVLSRVRTCNNITVKSIDYRLNVTEPLSNKVMSKSQLETSREISKISIVRNPSRLQRTMSNQLQSRDTRLLVEEVKRRRSNINKNRSRNISGIVYQPPLLKTPSESWLCRTLPRSSLTSVNSDQVAGFMKMERKNIPQSIKWETIVKTSYPTLRS